MRIGIDGGCLANRRGFGRFARESLTALAAQPSAHEFVVFVDRPSAEFVSIPKRCEVVQVEVKEAPSSAASARGRRGVRDLMAMGRAVARAHLDLMFFPASYSFFPVWNVARVVVTMHDTLALTHPQLVFPTWQGRWAWTLKEHAAVRWADTVLTVSEASRRDLLAWFKLSPARIRVVTEGPDDLFQPGTENPDSRATLARYGVESTGRYFLYVGGLSPHKNLPRLLEAFDRVGRNDVSLVIVGDTGDVFHTHIPELKEIVARLGLRSRVNFTGFVPDADLVHFYRRAYALVQPSLKEGFGLPAVEAMACGTPVVASAAGSLPEIVGDGGVLFDPIDVGSIANALRDLLNDPARRDLLATRALRRSQRFTWAASACAILDAFESLAPRPRDQRIA